MKPKNLLVILFAVLFLNLFNAKPVDAQCTLSFTYTLNGLDFAGTPVVGASFDPTSSSSFWTWSSNSILALYASNIGFPDHIETLPWAGNYDFCVYAEDTAANAPCSAQVKSCQMITVTGITSINKNLSSIFSLSVYPNPAGDRTNIVYTLAKEGMLDLSAFDLLGNKVAAIENGSFPAGAHHTTFETNALPQGIYLLKLVADEKTVYHKLVVAK